MAENLLKAQSKWGQRTKTKYWFSEHSEESTLIYTPNVLSENILINLQRLKTKQKLLQLTAWIQFPGDNAGRETNRIQWSHWTCSWEATLTRFCMAVYQIEGSCIGREQGTTEKVLTRFWLSKDLNIVRNDELRQGKIRRKRVLRAHTWLGIFLLFPGQNGKNV